MLVAFFESVKYVGHLFPISFLRVYLGYYYFKVASLQLRSDFLTQPKLAAQIGENLNALNLPNWYRHLVAVYYIPNSKILATTVLGIELIIAISYLLGYVVRPVALLGFFLSLNLWALTPVHSEDMYKILIAIHLVLGWLGAGRCLGVDYYFYKRRRGIWW